jgi:hypothetical protein
MFGLTGDGSAKSMAKMITKITVLGAAFAPLMLVVGGVGRIFGGLIGTFLGAGRAIVSLLGGLGPLVRLFTSLRWAVMGPVLAIGLLAAKFVNFKKIWAGIKEMGVVHALIELWETVKGLGRSMGDLLASMTGVQGTGEGWKTFGKVVGGVFNAMIVTVKTVIKGYRAILDLFREIRDYYVNLGMGGKYFKPKFTEFKNKSFATGLEFKPKELGGGGKGGAPLAGTTKALKPAKDAMVQTTGLIPVSAGDVVLDRASLAGAVVSQLRGGLAGAAGAGALGGGDPGRTSPPQAAPSAPLRIEVPVEIDGRQVARAVAEVQLDEMERGGVSLAPGARRGFLERGLVGAES